MSSRPIAPRDLVVELSRARLAAAEVYTKAGRSRRYEWTDAGSGRSRAELLSTVRSSERGWAIRAGNDVGSMLVTGSGDPGWPIELPRPSGRPLRLPDPPIGEPPDQVVDLVSADVATDVMTGAAPASPVRSTSKAPDPADDATPVPPLARESDARALLQGMAEAFHEEVPGGRLLQVVLEDGESESYLANSKDWSCSSRRRLATVRMWGSVRGDQTVEATFSTATRALSQFDGPALARRLADRLTIRQRGAVPERSVDPMLLAPEVMARLLASMALLFTNAEAWPRLLAWRDDRQKVAREVLTVIDDGRLAGGLLSSRWDDEGQCTRAVTLIERGQPRQPLVPWYLVDHLRSQSDDAEGPLDIVSSGCRFRPSWREPPRVAPSHLYIAPDRALSVADLLSGLERGFYLMAGGTPVFDWRKGTFSLAVLGFEVEAGEAVRPVKGCRLRGEIRALLSGVLALARDLRFLPAGGMVGAPTTLVEGLELLPG